MSSRAARLRRGTAVAASATYVAALSHCLGGGMAPSLLATVLAFAVAVPLCSVLLGRRTDRRSHPVRTVAAVALSQVAYHWLFSFFGPTASGLSSARAGAGVSAVSGHLHGPIDASGALAALSGVAEHTHHGPGMMLAHLAAGVLTVVMLLRGEAAFAALATALSTRIHRAVAALRSVQLPGRPLATADWWPLFRPRSSAGLLSVLSHRGPPQRLAH